MTTKQQKEFEIRYNRRKKNLKELKEKMVKLLPSDAKTKPWAISVFIGDGFLSGLDLYKEDVWFDHLSKYRKTKQKDIDFFIDYFIGNYLRDDSYPRLIHETKTIRLEYEDMGHTNSQADVCRILFEELDIKYVKSDFETDMYE